MILKRSFVIALGLVMAMFIAACGSYTTTGGGSYGYGSGTTNPPATTPTPGGSRSSGVQTATVTVNGQSVTVLTNAAGRTLYDLTADTPMSTACTGPCTSIWFPLLATGAPTSATPLPHQLSVLADGNGQQVEYDGHLLYTFSGDTAAGQAQGEGIQSFGGTWHVVTPTLSVPSGGSNGGYGQ
jgi:predicted lipoprotein with Yx(FWY)xxD motif